MKTVDTVVLATASEKTAALFFPRVVPLNYWNMGKSLKGDMSSFVKLLPDLLPPSLNSYEFKDLLVKNIELSRENITNTLKIGPQLASAIGRQSPYNSYEEILHDLHLGQLDHAKYFWERYSKYAEFVISKINSPISGIVGLLPPSDLGATKQESISCLISGIRIVDTGKTTWDHILAVRSNPDAMRRLRKFNVFWHNNYEGKDPEYIKDALAETVEQHADDLKSLGLPARESYYECIASTALLSSVVHALLGCFPIDYAALGVSFATSLANFGVKFMKRRLERSKLIKNHPLNFIFMDVNQE